ncbi:hypothetical protein [Pandoraea sp.]|uniref:hypothetical protein n=1 Tax=Pandoraea sp. TaxID=1883445 RepID=UPI0011F494D0|nr:hypothetical protein [Pandoraea sp.]MBU6491541.1 hypothetical protein [Burkholderiales bacterium]MDE2288428.1 hypothetical protein [Burkholderiales bacterium]MDE2608527.1 hypothetical protein [Burkholderiales bacterium]TAL57231.1 MAG: hypothetical protein EPN80_00185 [Pandoraea sp.]TAM16521.1 MAG: hypothetical protein EPN65_14595 [Pandoraea sp.]
MKKTDLEKLKGLKLTNQLKQSQPARGGKGARTKAGQPARASKLMNALLKSPEPEADERKAGD